MSMQIGGSVCFVTGSSRGIGRAMRLDITREEQIQAAAKMAPDGMPPQPVEV